MNISLAASDGPSFGFPHIAPPIPRRYRERPRLVQALPRPKFPRTGVALPIRPANSFWRLLEPRRRHDWALLTVIREAYASGAATRRVESMARALQLDALPADDLLVAERDLDRQLNSFRSRPIKRAFPYLVVDATVQSVRERGGVATVAAVFVAGIAPTGDRELLAVEVGVPGDAGFWRELFEGLRERGAYGVRLVTSDPHPGLEDAIRKAFPGASWQQSRTGFLRDALAATSDADRPALGRALRAVFNQPDRDTALALLRQARRSHRSALLATMLAADEEAVLTFYEVPAEHRQRVNSTTVLHKAHREIGRHCRMIGIFPSRAAFLRLCGVMGQEHNDEWVTGRRYLGARRDERVVVANHSPDGLQGVEMVMRGRPALRVVEAA